MKKTVLIAGFLLCAISLVNLSAQTTTVPKKILIVYFSFPEPGGVDAVSGSSRVVVNGKVSGNVEIVANFIQKATGGDIFRIQTVRTYPSDHRPLLDAAQDEQKANARPPLANHISNLQNYDSIFVGYPIWWYDLPMSLYSFFDEYNFAGKTVIPFTVHGGSRFSGTIEKIIQLEPQANVIKEGLAISRNSVAGSESEITAWLRRLGIVR